MGGSEIMVEGLRRLDDATAISEIFWDCAFGFIPACLKC
jgi:hypothetical protein